MNQNTPKSRLLVSVVVIAVGVLLYLRLQPTIVAESHHPRSGGGYIRIVAVPRSWFDALTVRDNPFYRFEYHSPRDYLWSAATFAGHSFYPQKASVIWESETTATAYLDSSPYFQLRDGLWHLTE